MSTVAADTIEKLAGYPREECIHLAFVGVKDRLQPEVPRTNRRAISGRENGRERERERERMMTVRMGHVMDHLLP